MAPPRTPPRLLAPQNALAMPLGQHLRALCAAGIAGPLGEWHPHVQAWRDSPEGLRLVSRIEARQAQGAVVYPADVLHALTLTPLSDVRVLILGQDPYHSPGQAQGLAFSVPEGLRCPPSLRNILQELSRDLGSVSEAAGRGDLQHWARQGVLLLNTCLTVEDGHAGAHARWGWETLTDALVRAVAKRAVPLAAMLWGAHAQAKAPLMAVQGQPRLILTAHHPSPLSARRPPHPFLGCGHFSQVQSFLAQHEPHRPPICW